MPLSIQNKAKIVGEYFMHELKKLKIKFPHYISNISGRGLFIGIDLIKNGNPLFPNTILAKDLINSLRNKGILLSTDGPFNNVIKIKPPMVFNKENVDQVCNAINKFLI